MNVPANMAAMSAAGGPVGVAGAPMMAVGARSVSEPSQDQRMNLNTYIYDYLLKCKHYDLARNFLAVCQINKMPQQNGINDSMDTDSKDGLKKPSNLPDPSIPPHSSDESFLFEWWCMFWDVFGAARRKPGTNPTTIDYLGFNINQSRMRQAAQSGLFQQTADGKMGVRMPNQYAVSQNGINMAKAAMQNNRNANPQLGMQQKVMPGQMPRDSDRPMTPSASLEGHPSPSKRPRTEGGMQNLPVTAAANGGQLLLQNGLNPSELPQNQLNAFSGPNGQQKALEAMAAQQGMDTMEFINNRMAGNANQTGDGRGALQDYQTQLMLLEQQNKRRLLQARREQDNIIGGAMSSAPQSQMAFAPNMSPSGSRGGGPSPNPTEMKRVGGTPKMPPQTGLPGSPMPDQQNRNSPNPTFDPQGMPQQYFQGGVMNRPPSSHPNFPMGAMTAQQIEQIRMTGRLPNGAPWPGHPGMMANAGQQPHMANPQQVQAQQQQAAAAAAAAHRQNMPPPPAPTDQQRTQESSPAQSAAAPPTPSSQNKSLPKKKDAANSKKKAAPNKKGATAAAATPAAEGSEPPPTPTPSTPITPMHHQSFNKANPGAPAQAANAQSQQAAQPNIGQAGMDSNASGNAQFGSMGDDSNGFSLDFAGLESDNVLESFDFDSFLHNTEDGVPFGNTFDAMNFGNTNGVKG